MNSSEYQVTIKSANQKVDDYMTKCRPGWTVLQLKQHISETHINTPRVEDQRLIYAGNLLQDTQTLKQIFFRDSLCTELTNSSKTDFTIHLVCYSHTYRSAGGNPSSSNGAQASSSRPSPPAANIPSSTPATNSAPTGLNRARPANASITTRITITNQQTPVTRIAPIASLNNQNILSAAPSATLNATQQSEMIQNLMQSDQMRQQMALFQQLAYMVAAQIATNLANSSTNNNPSPRNSTSNETLGNRVHMPATDGQTLNVRITNSPIASAASQLLYADNRQQAQFVQNDARETSAATVHQNENINNENNINAPGVAEPAGAQYGFGGQIQGGPAPVVEQPAPQPEQDAPMMQRDVIDWVYYSIRAAGLMFALYIHASMFRLLFIVGLLAIAYFFNRRRVLPANRHEAAQPQPPPQQLNPGGEQQANQENGELRRRNVNPGEQPNAGDNVNNDTGEVLRARDEVNPARVPLLKLCYLVVTDFLASLVPE